MFGPRRYPADTMRHSAELATPCRTWPHLFVGLVLAMGGFIVVIAGMPGLTAPPISPHGVETTTGDVNRMAGPATMAPPLRLSWMQLRRKGWSQATETGRNLRSPSRVPFPYPRTDFAASAYQAAAPVATETSGHEQFFGGTPGRDPTSSSAGSDLRSALTEMVSAQRGISPRQCPCPMVMAERGAR